jgi:hypothetical protein
LSGGADSVAIAREREARRRDEVSGECGERFVSSKFRKLREVVRSWDVSKCLHTRTALFANEGLETFFAWETFQGNLLNKVTRPRCKDRSEEASQQCTISLY